MASLRVSNGPAIWELEISSGFNKPRRLSPQRLTVNRILNAKSVLQFSKFGESGISNCGEGQG
jgi:hypothetical protein